ncbi:MAG: hypothetical protein U1C47_02310 [Hydrogenophaga sp.]|nr:hypothetical protein [Hydrogenophaga sp.]
MSNLNTRVEKLELATQRTKPPVWLVALAGMCGIAPEDVEVPPGVMTIEDLVAGSFTPDTSDGNRTE